MTVRVITGDCRIELARLPAASVHCVVTSPPYYCLRDYQVAGQIGLEATPDDYVAELLAVFREVRRVLRPDGCVWLNLGDSYSSKPPGNGVIGVSRSSTLRGVNSISDQYRATLAAGHGIKWDTSRIPGIKEKDLIGIPWMVAFALRADGWWLRSDVIWHKPNPMPESVKDRPTSSHEHVFLLTPSSVYFFDAEPVREGIVTPLRTGSGKGKSRAVPPYHGQYASSDQSALDQVGRGAGRNRTNVWTISSGASTVEHHAMMPPRLAELCILSGTSEAGCCRACGAPLKRIIKKGKADFAAQQVAGGDAAGSYIGQSRKDHDAAGVQNASDVKRRILAGMKFRRTDGWRSTCECVDAGTPVACTVLDPFGGAGTTGLVADRLGRNAVLIELNPDHARTAGGRIMGDAPLLAEVTD